MPGPLDLQNPASSDDGPDVVTGAISAANSNLASGTPTPNSFVLLSATDADTLALQISGTFVGTVVVQGSIDGQNWLTLSSLINIAGGASVASLTAPAIVQADVAGLSYVRITASAYTSGTINVSASLSDNTGVVGVDGAVVLGTGSNSIGTVSTPSGSAISVVSTAGLNSSVQKASAGNLFEITVSNPTATPAYVKLYNKATAPTVGTDVPVMTIPVAATAAGVGTVSIPFGNIGKRFTAGIGVAITGAAAAADTTNAVAGVQVHGSYI